MKNLYCLKLKVLITAFFVFSVSLATGQVKVRLFASQSPDFAIFTVTEGEYLLEVHGNAADVFKKDDIIVISKYNNRLAIKPRQSEGFVVDSVIFKALSDNSSFSLRINTQTNTVRNYNGDFLCYPDLATILMINNCNIEDYVAGVVIVEGGVNRHSEYIKTQAIITRTYLYKHFDKHIQDKYNVCDNTHCQAFHGITNNQAINLATVETKGIVILDKNSELINSAFHSNCGGMTADSKDVWVSDLPYLRSVVDPHCVNSPNAVWERKFTLEQWIDYLQKSGYKGSTNDVSLLNFSQNGRLLNYNVGTFIMSFEKIRADNRLRSSFFSVVADDNSVTLQGRGYGHRVGLCQEGAMAMAAKGSTYSEIISFYYSGAITTDLKNAKLTQSTVR